ncbi:DNA gyrase subunit A, partial [Corynebacterium diphtheriae]
MLNNLYKHTELQSELLGQHARARGRRAAHPGTAPTPHGRQILGRKGIEEVYRTGRGPITMRAVVNVEEIQGRTCLVVTELPYMTNPDNLAAKIAEMVRDGKINGIADMRDETSGRTGQRLVIVLKRDAVAKVVLNNLYKHTELQSELLGQHARARGRRAAHP